MKNLLLIGSLLLTAFSAATSFAQEDASSSPDALMTLSANPFARTGMSRAHLVDQLGQPSAKLSATVWVYWDFRPVGRPASERWDTLVVVFTNDRVSHLRLGERSRVEAALIKVRANAPKAATVATK